MSKYATFLQRVFKNYLVSTLQKFYWYPFKDEIDINFYRKIFILNNKSLKKIQFNTYGCHFGQIFEGGGGGIPFYLKNWTFPRKGNESL